MDERDRPGSRLGRRAFLGLLGIGALVLPIGGLIRFLEPPKKFIRPPGALPEDEFLALCTRCGQCQQICPTIITMVPFSESILAAGTPRVLFGCSHCMRCNYFCPTGALHWGR